MKTVDGSTTATPVQKPVALRPRDAATLILVDSASGTPKVLFGKRRMDMKFMPGRYVFPGGRVDKTDRLGSPATTSARRRSPSSSST